MHQPRGDMKRMVSVGVKTTSTLSTWVKVEYGDVGESGLNQQIANLSSVFMADRRFESFHHRHKTHTAIKK